MKPAVLGLAALLVILPAVALARGHYDRHSNHDWHSQSQRHERTHQEAPPVETVPTTKPIPDPVPKPTPIPGAAAGEKQFDAYITGYSYYDNTPPGSADISNPVIHQKAGGVGTFGDPATLAVGHSLGTGKDVLDYPAGTKFYVPDLRRYFIVEDTCGDGGSPQNGPCHTGYQGHPWLDVWVGKGASKSASDACMDKITEVHTVIENPNSGYPVVSGDIAVDCVLY